MNANETSHKLRTKILGVLLKDARLASGKTVKECAEAMGCKLAVYVAYEAGRKSPSLPELELLAYCLGMPVTHFWDNQSLTESAQATQAVPATELTPLRNRIIGAQLRKARLAAKCKLKALAAEVGVPSGRLSAYELGEKAAPLPELEVIALRLGLRLEDLLETQGTIGEWDSTRRAFQDFRQLPAELREFVSHPLNENYLRLAQRLSQLPAAQLRSIAESLLEITY